MGATMGVHAFFIDQMTLCIAFTYNLALWSGT